MPNTPIARVAADLARHPSTLRTPRRPRACPLEDADADYRAAWGRDGRRPYGRPLRAAYYAYLPDAPRGRYVGRDDAARYLAAIDRVIERQCWSRSEQERLRRLRERWRRRAHGEDARYAALGVQGGVNERYRARTAADKLDVLRQDTGVAAPSRARYTGVRRER